ncbi:MAG: ferrous iron transport protein B, partial [Planctomycetota bacterium]
MNAPPSRASGPPQATTATAEQVVALVGNPNTGKTALFNALTGFRRHVANYPGVTVETASGPIRGAARSLTLLDLPGVYSLAPMSPDEIVATDVLFGRAEPLYRRPNAIIAIVDASNIERNFYLVTQLLELGLPIVIALNMIDIAARRGIRIDHQRLSERLGVPVVPVIATRKATVAPLVAAVEKALDAPPPEVHIDLPLPLAQAANQLRRCGAGMTCGAESLRILLDHDGHAERAFLQRGGSPDELRAARQRLTVGGCVSPADEVRARYAWIHRVLAGIVHRPPTAVQTWSDRLDR